MQKSKVTRNILTVSAGVLKDIDSKVANRRVQPETAQLMCLSWCPSKVSLLTLYLVCYLYISIKSIPKQ